jgi:hypothetical protein
MHARIQTWFPFCIHVCINGRDWLSRRMDREGLRYFRQANCFPWVEDVARAQQIFQEQLTVNWTERLQPLAQSTRFFELLPNSRTGIPYSCTPSHVLKKYI